MIKKKSKVYGINDFHIVFYGIPGRPIKSN